MTLLAKVPSKSGLGDALLSGWVSNTVDKNGFVWCVGTEVKLDGKAVIEPSGVIEERRKIGLHPSGPVPEGAIICYDSALWQWISSLPERKECDGWLKGSYPAPQEICKKT